MADPNRPAELFQCYTRGWQHGAGGSAQDPKFTGHSDAGFVAEYEEGYLVGYKARKAMKAATAARLGHTPQILRLQGKDGSND